MIDRTMIVRVDKGCACGIMHSQPCQIINPAYVEQIEAENEKFKKALSVIETGQICKAHQCSCGLSPEEIAKAALKG